MELQIAAVNNWYDIDLTDNSGIKAVVAVTVPTYITKGINGLPSIRSDSERVAVEKYLGKK